MPESIRASHILLSYVGSAEAETTRSKDEAFKEITALRSAIEGGADFADTAREHSDCPSSEDGGDLGFFESGDMVPEFESAAFKLDIGAVSDVVETPFGYHLVQRTG